MPNWKKVVISGSSAKLANETFISGHITASGIVKAEHLFSTDDAQITDDLEVGGNIDLEGNIDVNGTSNLDVVDIDGAVDMASTLTVAGNLLIASNLQHVGDDNNEISFGTDTQDFRTNNSSRLDISNSGIRLGGANARVTTILDEDAMGSDSATSLATQQSIKAYVDANAGSGDVTLSGTQTFTGAKTFGTNTKLAFRDGAIVIFSSTDGQLDIDADDTVQIATTTLDINGAVDISGTTALGNTVTLASTKKLQFRDTGLYINSSTDGQLDIVADTEIQIAATTIDINGAINASGEIIAASLDISGNADIDGTLEADAITVNGTSLSDTISGTTVTNATNAAHVLITDNENTNEHNQITFIEGAAGGTANRGLEADGHLTYNPSKGLVIAPNFSASGEIHAAGNITASGTGSFVGGVDLLDNNYLNIGTGDDLRLYHNATDTFIDNETGHLNIRNLADDKDIIFGCDDGSGGVETYFFLDGSAGSDKPITTFPDNSKLRFGSGGDLVLLHDATDSKITNNVGDLIIDSAANDKDIIFKGTDGGADITALTLDMSAAGKATFNNTVVIPSLQFKISSTTHGNSGGGDVVYFGSTTSMTAGQIYYYNASGNWALTDADAVATADGMIGVALGAASDTNGVMLRGMTTLDHDPGTVGDPLFLSTTAGKATSTAPSGNGDIVRVIGYCLGSINGEIYFNPSGTFVEVTA